MKKNDGEGPGTESSLTRLDRVALVSTPWPLFNRPSIQLGALKSHVRSRLPDVEVTALHFYLKVAADMGYDRYHAISGRTWLAEPVYGALLHPGRIQSMEKIFQREAAGKSELRGLCLEGVAAGVRKTTDAYIQGIDWGRFGLVGFSICLCQLTSTLYFIQRIKRLFPDLFVVVGGSSFAGESVRECTRAFPMVDAAVNGEGERPLVALIRHLRDHGGAGGAPDIPGVAFAETAGQKGPPAISQTPDPDKLAVPDFDEYFALLKSLGPKRSFFPILPAEISRGCWWCGPKKARGASGCAFCNLNRQWDGYRCKTPRRAASEIDHLTERYKVLSVAFTDNLTPLKGAEKIFGELERLGKDLELFSEIRAITPRRVLAAMARAGVTEVQIGIEALSTRLLKKLNKGSTAIQNLEIMRNCEELGVVNRSNLIIHFPGSDRRDVEETIRTLAFARPFRPARVVRFWLGAGSPVWREPKRFGLKAIFNHPNYSRMLPPEVTDHVRFMIQAYRGDLGRQRTLWRPVKNAAEAWQKEYDALVRGSSPGPILGSSDGRTFLIIRQRRLGAETLTHRLMGPSRSIYLFCRKNRSIKRICGRFPDFGEEKVLPFLRMMKGKKLMYEENGRWLSLAARAVNRP